MVSPLTWTNANYLSYLNVDRSDQLELNIDGVNVKATEEVELLGVIIDNKLQFKSHIAKLIKKVGKQLDVLSRLKNILSFSSKMRIYRSFIMSHFSYCSSVWNNCLKEDSNRLERLHERALRYVYNDFSSEYSTLCGKIGYSLANRRIQDIVIITFKALTSRFPTYTRSLFNLRDNQKNLRGINKLVLPPAKTTWHGLNSTSYVAAKAWNLLSDNIRSMDKLNPFKKAVRKITFEV